MKCYVLIICLAGTNEGGETKLYMDEDTNTKIINETRTTGGCLVFRNEYYRE